MFQKKNLVNEKTGEKYTKYFYTFDESDPIIGILFGHFAPFTGPNGHGRMVKALKDKGAEAFLIVTPESSKPFDDEREMFSSEQRAEIIQSYLDSENIDGFGLPWKMRRGGAKSQMGPLVALAAEKFGLNIRPVFCFGPDREDLAAEVCNKFGEIADPTHCEYIVDYERGTSGTKVRELIRKGDIDGICRETGYKPEVAEKLINLRNENLKSSNLKYFESQRRNMNFRKIYEGGNLTLNGHSATKLQVAKMNNEEFSDFKEDFLAFLLSVSDIYQEQYGYPIWNREDLLFSGKVFSGSTRTFFQKDREVYANKKPKVGDFDIQVPESIHDTFHEFVMNDLPDMEIGDFVVHGCSASPGQDHCLVKANKYYPEVGADYIQLDWEYVPFKNNEPTDFATFAHYSSWEDIEHDVKGVFMKYLMRALTSTVDQREVIIVSAKTGKPLASANKNKIKHFMSFSVDKGIRTRFVPCLDENGEIKTIDGLECWYEQPTKESVYTKDVGAMYQLIFNETPTESEKRDLHSFIRTLNKLMPKLDSDRIADTFESFCNLLWSPGAQGISAFDAEEDKEIKTTAYEQFLKAFPELKKYSAEIEDMKAAYYENYKISERK